jgi:glycogen debranching enzyme
MDAKSVGPPPPVEWKEVEDTGDLARMFSLKDRDTFLVADAYGDILGRSDGLFHNDTRILSRWRMQLGEKSPTLLSGAVSQDNVVFTAHSLNKTLPAPGGPMGPAGILHIERSRFLWDERLYERIRISNYSSEPIDLPVSMEFAADFRDMFELRGAVRRRRGRTFRPEFGQDWVRFRYHGLDKVERRSVISFSEPPTSIGRNRAYYELAIPGAGCVELHIEVGDRDAPRPTRTRFRAAAARARFAMRGRRRHGARLRTSGRLFNGWIEKSRADLALLTTPLETGPYPYAGIPWFSTAFGRDGIISAWQVLWFDPSLARGVLSYLSAHQAEEVSAFRDSAPGKIMHETRRGEMAAMGEVPFGRYYGGVDTTPLFIALAGAYAERTGDQEFVAKLLPSLDRAAAWIVRRASANPHGLLDYERGAKSGLSNQGWKDSGDSVFHADGRFPAGPIALVEVQGYAYAAYQVMAEFARLRDDPHGAERWCSRAENLRETVERLFWMDEEGSYGIALDGDGELCRVMTSNPGHLLFCGLPSPERARRVADALISPGSFSGWGVRTLRNDQPRYNPMSYHNGSIWPHDTALCALGLSRYGERERVVRMTAGLFEAATDLEMRLPELLCGFERSPGERPISYPVACLPQAWAAGSVFMLLQACLGLSICGRSNEVDVRNPHLPLGIDHLTVERLSVGGEKITLRFDRVGARVTVRAEARQATVRLLS